MLVLTNAIYFKGAWMHAFREEDTKPADFASGAKGTIRNVPLMSQQHTHQYLDGDTFQALELPYEAHELSMIIFLPRRVDGLAGFRADAHRRARDGLGGEDDPARRGRCPATVQGHRGVQARSAR